MYNFCLTGFIGGAILSIAKGGWIKLAKIKEELSWIHSTKGIKPHQKIIIIRNK